MVTEDSKIAIAKRKIVSQSDFPQLSIQKALRIIRAIWEQYAGHPTPPHDIALAIGLEPTSGTWRNLAGTSIAYGLTEGGYAAKAISLTTLGRRIVAPTVDGDEKRALIEAVLKPKIMGMFFSKYDHAKFPDDRIAENVLMSFGLPKERTKFAVEILKENGLSAGILRETQSGFFVALDEPMARAEGQAIIDEELSIQMNTSEDLGASKIRGKSRFSFEKGIYVNFEIHIAANTPIETIEAIFKNMKKYLIEDEQQ